jgi:hypothetical protein
LFLISALCMYQWCRGEGEGNEAEKREKRKEK